MNTYRFRLASVLRLRVVQENATREQLYLANVRLKAAIARRDRAMASFSALQTTTEIMSRDELLAELQQEDLGATLVRSLQFEVGRAAAAVVDAQLVWTSARRSLKALERLDTRRRGEYADADAREQANDIDDIVSAGYLRRELPVGASR